MMVALQVQNSYELEKKIKVQIFKRKFYTDTLKLA